MKNKIKKINSEKVALKILNELKFNKRLMNSWIELTKIISNDDNILIFFKNRIEYLLNSKNISDNSSISTKVQLFKKIKKQERTVENKEKNLVNVVSFDKEKEVDIKLIEFNDFIKVDLDMFLLSAIWVETLGVELDKSLTDDIYANRISDQENTFFELYFSAYNLYRNSAFNEMDHLIDNSQSGVAIQLDLQKCFYNIDIDFLEKEVTQYFEDSLQDEFNYRYKDINQKIFECIKNYNKLGETKCNLPIGFLPSNILINFYLKKFDEIIIKDLNPISYGRYVDDITIVLKRNIDADNMEEEIKELDNRIENLRKQFIEQNQIKEEIKFNSDKKVYFVINKSSDHNYIKKFKKSTERLSSDFYRLIDVNELDIEIDSAYEIVDDPVKLEELFKIHKDKKAITKTTSAVFYSLYAEPIKNKKLNKKLAGKFIEKFDEFIDNEMFLEIYDYWLPIILIEFVSLNIEYTAILNQNKFDELKVIKRLKKYSNESKYIDIKEFDNFINCYLDLFKALFLRNTSRYLDNLLSNFIMPKFLNSMFQDSYLVFENQLSYLNRINVNKPIDIRELINEFNEKIIKDIEDSRAVKYGIKKNETTEIEDDILLNKEDKKEINNEELSVQKIKRFDEYPIIDLNFECLEDLSDFKVSQVGEINPKERNKQFIKFSTNNDKSSETIAALNSAAIQNSDILIFPEHGLNITDISKLVKFTRRTQIPIVGGLDYILLGNTVLNLTIAIIPFPAYKSKDVFYQDCAIIVKPKRYPAPKEHEEFSNSSCRSNLSISRNIYIPTNEENKNGINFKFKGIIHSVLNCYEATDLKIKADLNSIKPDIVHIVANNKDINYYDSIGEVISRELMTISTITNYSIYGGTQIIIPFKKRFQQLVSYHKGSEVLHVFTSKVDIEALRNKKSNNSESDYRQNPPRIFYKNVIGESNE
ncbi:hypothetical protein BFC22_10625 [Carnobacterium divergens]|uniref:RNA-directed DNA polymerase n=1 Tax=Carnobacterium divergens TaxID=2748 RepID=UPI000E747564|nr:RNA-directed DNA polymerase [Carnobacterium divergens]AOA00515.1 hypothetical protein BFC22_10625 [Carnobacterium divergens]